MKVKVNIDEKIDEIFIEIYTPSKEDENLRFILEDLKMKKSVLNAYGQCRQLKKKNVKKLDNRRKICILAIDE